MNHEWVRIQAVNVKDCRVVGVTMATDPDTVYESANIGINYYNSSCSYKVGTDYLLLIS